MSICSTPAVWHDGRKGTQLAGLSSGHLHSTGGSGAVLCMCSGLSVIGARSGVSGCGCVGGCAHLRAGVDVRACQSRAGNELWRGMMYDGLRCRRRHCCDWAFSLAVPPASLTASL